MTVDLLAECFASETADTIWLPLDRATTDRGVLRQVARYLRDTGMDSRDVREHFEAAPRIAQVWAVVDGEGWLRTWWPAPDFGRCDQPVKEGDDGATLWWQVSW